MCVCDVCCVLCAQDKQHRHACYLCSPTLFAAPSQPQCLPSGSPSPSPPHSERFLVLGSFARCSFARSFPENGVQRAEVSDAANQECVCVCVCVREPHKHRHRHGHTGTRTLCCDRCSFRPLLPLPRSKQNSRSVLPRCPRRSHSLCKHRHNRQQQQQQQLHRGSCQWW